MKPSNHFLDYDKDKVVVDVHGSHSSRKESPIAYSYEREDLITSKHEYNIGKSCRMTEKYAIKDQAQLVVHQYSLHCTDDL